MAEIIWQGLTSFRLRGKDATIVTDPFDRGLGLEVAHPRADIVTVSQNDPRFNAVSVVKGDPHVLHAPGEYEVKGIFITGVGSFADAKKGELRGKNTIFVYEVDDLVICPPRPPGPRADRRAGRGVEQCLGAAGAGGRPRWAIRRTRRRSHRSGGAADCHTHVV